MKDTNKNKDYLLINKEGEAVSFGETPDTVKSNSIIIATVVQDNVYIDFEWNKRIAGLPKDEQAKETKRMRQHYNSKEIQDELKLEIEQKKKEREKK